jgi:hypothetical protein
VKRKPKRRVNVKAIPKLVFTSEHGSIEVRTFAIYIHGAMEGAALALAEDILKKMPRDAAYDARELYLSVFAVSKDAGKDSKYELTLLKPAAINADSWVAFKKDVEKICNRLTAFM